SMTSRLSFIFENYTTIYRIFTSISKILLKSFPEIIRKSLKQKSKVIFVPGSFALFTGFFEYR
ncbi:hypothetical protein, partial [Streptococcus pneumoniae]|uniref:hypothetical protein n=1 Tax=Streptococcus pneumoniae TaxID=1313 RepID=UPI000FB286D3